MQAVLVRFALKTNDIEPFLVDCKLSILTKTQPKKTSNTLLKAFRWTPKTLNKDPPKDLRKTPRSRVVVQADLGHVLL